MQATECAGAIGVAVGKQMFAQNNVLISMMKLACDGMQLNYFELRDSTYQFFESMAEMLGTCVFLFLCAATCMLPPAAVACCDVPHYSKPSDQFCADTPFFRGLSTRTHSLRFFLCVAATLKSCFFTLSLCWLLCGDETGGKDFLPFLQTVMTFILATLHSDDGVVMHEQNEDINAGGRKLVNQLPEDGVEEPDAQPDADGDEDEDDDLTVERNINFSIRSGALDEKTSALRTVCVIMEQVGAPFLAFMVCLFTCASLPSLSL